MDRRLSAVFGLLALVLLRAPSVLAQEPEGPETEAPAAEAAETLRFDDLVKTALEQYSSGAYQAAADTFEAAYALDARPELVYNVARSLEKALRPDEAIAAYERFIKLPGTTAELRTKALDALTALREERNARARAEAAEREPEARPAAGTAPPSVGVEGGAPRQLRSRVLEWTLMGSGVAIAGAGAAFGVLALNRESDWKDAQSRGEPASRVDELVSETERNALLADILIGVGAVTTVTGIIVYLARGDTEPAVSLAPTATRDGGGGLVLSGRF